MNDEVDELAQLKDAVARIAQRTFACWTMVGAERMDRHHDPALRSSTVCVTVRVFADAATASRLLAQGAPPTDDHRPSRFCFCGVIDEPGVCLGCAPLAEALSALKASEAAELPREIPLFDRIALGQRLPW